MQETISDRQPLFSPLTPRCKHIHICCSTEEVEAVEEDRPKFRFLFPNFLFKSGKCGIIWAALHFTALFPKCNQYPAAHSAKMKFNTRRFPLNSLLNKFQQIHLTWDGERILGKKLHYSFIQVKTLLNRHDEQEKKTWVGRQKFSIQFPLFFF